MISLHGPIYPTRLDGSMHHVHAALSTLPKLAGFPVFCDGSVRHVHAALATLPGLTCCLVSSAMAPFIMHMSNCPDTSPSPQRPIRIPLGAWIEQHLLLHQDTNSPSPPYASPLLESASYPSHLSSFPTISFIHLTNNLLHRSTTPGRPPPAPVATRTATLFRASPASRMARSRLWPRPRPRHRLSARRRRLPRAETRSGSGWRRRWRS